MMTILPLYRSGNWGTQSQGTSKISRTVTGRTNSWGQVILLQDHVLNHYNINHPDFTSYNLLLFLCNFGDISYLLASFVFQKDDEGRKHSLHSAFLGFVSLQLLPVCQSLLENVIIPRILSLISLFKTNFSSLKCLSMFLSYNSPDTQIFSDILIKHIPNLFISGVYHLGIGPWEQHLNRSLSIHSHLC